MAGAQPLEHNADPEPGISAEIAIAFANALSMIEAGVPYEQLLSPEQLAPLALRSTHSFVPASRFCKLCEHILDEIQGEGIGLRLGEQLSGHGFSLIQMLMVHAETLQHAFELLMRYSKLFADQPGIHLTVHDDTITISRCGIPGASPRLQRVIDELSLTGIYRVVRAFSFDARPSYVGFAHQKPAYAEAYRRVFGGIERFNQSATGITFCRDVLKARCSNRDDGLHRALQSLAERRIMERTYLTPHALRVRDFLIRQEAPHRVPMAAVARAVHTSVRSLHRRLSSEGTSFVEVANAAAAAVAKRLIVDEHRPIKEAAYLMGFKDCSSFHRAFKRWTNMTPTAFRDAELRKCQ